MKNRVLIACIGASIGLMTPVAHAGGPVNCGVADYTNDGVLDFFDISFFLQAFQAQNPIADLTGEGIYDFFDVSAFLQAFSQGCQVDMTDSDNDRIPDYAETNDGIFVNAEQTGTDPFNPDTDNDGINDGDEILGTINGLDLPAMGADPLRRDIFVEVDWFAGFIEGENRDFRPTQAGIERIQECYADSGVSNPYNGAPGINMHIDYGQGGAFTGGNQLPGTPVSITFDFEFNLLKQGFFNSNRAGYFHYSIFANRYNSAENGSSGIAEVHGNDFMVTLQGFNSDYNMSQTFVHEIGHNLGLRHGGNENTNWKPNYNSVMNYRHQFPGVDTNGSSTGNGVLDYSRGLNIDLNEFIVREINGVIGLGVDFNGNGVIEPIPYSANLNCFAVFVNPCGEGEGCDDAECDILRDHDDWSNINWNRFNSQTDRQIEREIIECDNNPNW